MGILITYYVNADLLAIDDIVHLPHTVLEPCSYQRTSN
jgi:hypothetical protein